MDKPESMTDPSDLDLSSGYLQRLKNRGICQGLLGLGDDLVQPRVIDHVASFDDRKDRELFLDFILGAGFEIVSLPEPDDVGSRYDVTFSRKNAPSEIDQVVLPLLVKAEALDGTYDGWNCEVIAS